MPADFRKLRREIEDQGLFLEETKKGHYKILSADGTVLTVFAVSHGKSAKRGEVLDCYVRPIRKLIQSYKERS